MISQTKEQVEEMKKAGYPVCLSKGDWKGDYERHCNSCVKIYRKQQQRLNK